MWKFQDFLATQILREISLGHFEAPKTAILTSCEFLISDKYVTFSRVKYSKKSKAPKNAKFRYAQKVKMAVFGASKWPKLISRKI